MTDKLTFKDVQAVLAYAHQNMKVVLAAKELHIDYRTLSLRLDAVYRKTALDPKKFRDLIVLVNAIEDEAR